MNIAGHGVRKKSPSLFLLHAAGEQEENGLGASGGRTGDLGCRPRTDAQRIACRPACS